MYKIIVAVACLAAFTVALPYKPAAEPEYYEHNEGHHNAQYKFEYGVNDAHTGDHKTQWEHRDGKHVKGQYTLDEADGGHRVVEYESDAHGGIQIQVKKVGGGGGHGPAPKVHAPAPHYEGDSYAGLKKHHY